MRSDLSRDSRTRTGKRWACKASAAASPAGPAPAISISPISGSEHVTSHLAGRGTRDLGNDAEILWHLIALHPISKMNPQIAREGLLAHGWLRDIVSWHDIGDQSGLP